MSDFILTDDGEDWFALILAEHIEEARKRANSLLDAGARLETGCIVSCTTARKKVRFHGRQVAAYRFIYCVLNETAIGFDTVVRHRCHNPLCINPEHLELGSRADNKHDDWEAAAYGVDFGLL
ncbi:HNH endonuclease [Tabrizicola sp. J26]|uniref:HNH endonuclease n=1 Tax=Alitabrizicola rongguiensis TaxID=2909234 RepID=UPI001F2EA968|nr:HNH endonuclease [Tabrizicola rongguiensis]MCF1711164.1 HNH endonuclease [Tabrizicola rongguiensis]